jgi:sialidase-1
MLGPLFSPGRGKGLIDRQMLNVGPSTPGLQLSATNPHHPHRILFAGHHGAYEYDVVWYSDDGGATYTLARNASDPRKPAQLWHQDEIALAETPDGGVIASTRNEDFHSGYAGHESACNCRGVARSVDGGSSFG